jgi:hypothetical protein
MLSQRLLSKSMGNSTLDYQTWQRSVALDESRMARLDAQNQAASDSQETLLR